MKAASVRPTLPERVNTFVEWLFEGYSHSPPRGPKVFNDALLGNLFFAQHEVAVINSPLLQRLRRIKQTGLVHYVYPSATHSRFEHSLGAAALSERCFDAIVERANIEGTPLPVDTNRIYGDLAHLRMAALLHDVGHGLCSHASEQIYKQLTDMREFKNDPVYVRNQPGEILSYLIVNSPKFQAWFEECVVRDCQAKLNLKTISDLILGKHEPDKYFLANIISSAYDCDKLDYIARDSYYCGLALTVDLPRFYSMISTAKYKDHKVLVLRNYVPLEQILFSKMTLFGSVYHHQKVKCLDAMLRSMIGHVVENAKQASFPLRGGTSVSFTDPNRLPVRNRRGVLRPDKWVWRWVHAGDARSFFATATCSFDALRCSRRTVNNWEDGRQRLIDLTERPRDLDDVEAEIYKRLPPEHQRQNSRGDVRLSVPGLPPISGNALIQTHVNGPIQYVEEYFPVKQWTDAYAHNKWRSYVYAPNEIQEPVRDAAVSVLRDRFQMDINLDRSNEACHMR